MRRYTIVFQSIKIFIFMQMHPLDFYLKITLLQFSSIHGPILPRNGLAHARLYNSGTQFLWCKMAANGAQSIPLAAILQLSLSYPAPAKAGTADRVGRDEMEQGGAKWGKEETEQGMGRLLVRRHMLGPSPSLSSPLCLLRPEPEKLLVHV